MLALLLHLTDLHLDARAGHGVISDTKVAVIDEESLQKRMTTMSASLQTLARLLHRENRELDAIIITGDVTHQGEKAGFALLTDLLRNLGHKLPEKKRILIVPGNHDVPRGTQASTPARYENFLTLRKEGYLTAWLEGVDIDSDGQLLDGAGIPPILVGQDGSYVAVGVNSSNHSGSQRADEPNLVKHLPKLLKSGDEGVQRLLAAWRARGEDDIARVDRAQRRAVALLLQDPAVPSNALRLAAFHHHLYPVGDVEEIKAFESMTNLGEFQDWLASNKIALALHGHKHISRVGSVRYTPNGSTTEHQVLVVCGPSLREHDSNKSPIGRLIEIDASYPRSRPITLSDVPSTSDGVDLDWKDLSSHHQSIEDVGRSGQVVGQTLTETHHKLLALAETYDELPTPLICRVIDGSSCREVPKDFPDYAGLEPVDVWFKEIVEWWQRKEPGRAATFNHGERLYAFGFEQHDQISGMVKEINQNRATSRALATLVYPERDPHKEDFPSFTLVQLMVRGTSLDVVAYYRKQEMPHWWLVNIAELAKIQAEVLCKLNDKTLTPGSITTITAKPTGGRSVPRVAVPWVDREADNGEISTMLIPLFAAESSTDMVVEKWKRVFSDWVPNHDSPAADGDPLPRIGLRHLSEQFGRMRSLFPGTPEIAELATTLEALIGANSTYSEEQAEWSAWASRVRDLSETALRTVEKIVDRAEKH